MALWQLSFFVLPKEGIEPNSAFEKSNEGLFDDSKFWDRLAIRPSIFDPIETFLPKLNKPWGKYLILYGSENGNRLDVVTEGDCIDSVSFRVDFTSNYVDTLTELIDFFIFNGMIVLDQNLNVIPLNLESFKSLIQNSAQASIYSQLSSNENSAQ
jgi:hypothetical protein